MFGLPQSVGLFGFTIALVAVLYRWPSKSSPNGRRRQIASVALLCGLISIGLFGWFFIHIWLFNSLVFHGGELSLYEWAGISFAAFELVLALIAKEPLIHGNVFISFIAILEWLRAMSFSRGFRSIVDILVIGTVLVFIICLIRYRPVIATISSPAGG